MAGRGNKLLIYPMRFYELGHLSKRFKIRRGVKKYIWVAYSFNKGGKLLVFSGFLMFKSVRACFRMPFPMADTPKERTINGDFNRKFFESFRYKNLCLQTNYQKIFISPLLFS